MSILLPKTTNNKHKLSNGFFIGDGNLMTL